MVVTGFMSQLNTIYTMTLKLFLLPKIHIKCLKNRR